MLTAREIIKQLGGDWHSGYGLAPGPGHSPKDRSMRIEDRDDGAGIAVSSYASDDWQTCRQYLHQRGLVEDDRTRRDITPAEREQFRRRADKAKQKRDKDRAAKIAYARKLWFSSVPAPDTPAEAYLRQRGISVPVPDCIRFAPEIKHSPTKTFHPALIAGVQNQSERITAVQRIYLDSGGGKADLDENKRSVGDVGGGAVRLYEPGAVLALAESVEDGLALHELTGQPVWAVPGSSHFWNFEPPACVKTLILAPDPDKAGDGAAQKAAERLADKIKTLHLPSPDGRDWNELLDAVTERAAILQHDAGLSTSAARQAALKAVLGWSADE